MVTEDGTMQAMDMGGNDLGYGSRDSEVLVDVAGGDMKQDRTLLVCYNCISDDGANLLSIS